MPPSIALRFPAHRRSSYFWTTACLTLVSFVIVLRRALLRNQPTHARLYTRPTAHWVQHLIDGSPRPANLSFKAFMYECFKRDVVRGERGENLDIPTHDPLHRTTARLRIVSWNVHFFRSGYSNVVLGDGLPEAKRVLSHLQADVLLLQEVPPSLLGELRSWLHTAEAYEHFVAAPSADPHVLAADSAAFAGERLHVVIASRLPMSQSAAVPMANGGSAAFAEIELPSHELSNLLPGGPRKERQRATALLYSLHGSVRCEPAVRQQEVAALLQHSRSLDAPNTPSNAAVAAAGTATSGAATNAATNTATKSAAVAGPARPHIFAGDFNQPNEPDYPPHEWHAIAKDLAAAKLPATDGAMDALRAAGYVPSWEVGRRPRPLVGSSAWNGAVVDYCYVDERPPPHGSPSSLSPTLAVEATYVYHTLASDHLPLVVDFRFAD